jgi:hypothetical protein
MERLKESANVDLKNPIAPVSSAHRKLSRKRASGKSQSQTMRLRSLELGEFEIARDVGDNVDKDP